jgi:glyoxylase-like metal-dependent hydrolase (beta-lactamase superfamily II)
MQLLPNLYLLNGFAYATHANFYLLRSDAGNVLIDSGTFPVDLERAEQQLAVWGLNLDSVDHLLLTHAHYDHVANAATPRELHWPTTAPCPTWATPCPRARWIAWSPTAK